MPTYSSMITYTMYQETNCNCKRQMCCENTLDLKTVHIQQKEIKRQCWNLKNTTSVVFSQMIQKRNIFSIFLKLMVNIPMTKKIISFLRKNKLLKHTPVFCGKTMSVSNQYCFSNPKWYIFRIAEYQMNKLLRYVNMLD